MVNMGLSKTEVRLTFLLMIGGLVSADTWPKLHNNKSYQLMTNQTFKEAVVACYEMEGRMLSDKAVFKELNSTGTTFWRGLIWSNQIQAWIRLEDGSKVEESDAPTLHTPCKKCCATFSEENGNGTQVKCNQTHSSICVTMAKKCSKAQGGQKQCETEQGSHDNKALFIGVCVASAVALILSVIVGFLCIKLRRSQDESNKSPLQPRSNGVEIEMDKVMEVNNDMLGSMGKASDNSGRLLLESSGGEEYYSQAKDEDIYDNPDNDDDNVYEDQISFRCLSVPNPPTVHQIRQDCRTSSPAMSRRPLTLGCRIRPPSIKKRISEPLSNYFERVSLVQSENGAFNDHSQTNKKQTDRNDDLYSCAIPLENTAMMTTEDQDLYEDVENKNLGAVEYPKWSNLRGESVSTGMGGSIYKKATAIQAESDNENGLQNQDNELYEDVEPGKRGHSNEHAQEKDDQTYGLAAGVLLSFIPRADKDACPDTAMSQFPPTVVVPVGNAKKKDCRELRGKDLEEKKNSRREQCPFSMCVDSDTEAIYGDASAVLLPLKSPENALSVLNECQTPPVIVVHIHQMEKNDNKETNCSKIESTSPAGQKGYGDEQIFGPDAGVLLSSLSETSEIGDSYNDDEKQITVVPIKHHERSGNEPPIFLTNEFETLSTKAPAEDSEQPQPELGNLLYLLENEPEGNAQSTNENHVPPNYDDILNFEDDTNSEKSKVLENKAKTNSNEESCSTNDVTDLSEETETDDIKESSEMHDAFAIECAKSEYEHDPLLRRDAGDTDNHSEKSEEVSTENKKYVPCVSVNMINFDDGINNERPSLLANENNNEIKNQEEDYYINDDLNVSYDEE